MTDDRKNGRDETRDNKENLPDSDPRSGSATPLQPGGTKPGGTPGTSVGSIGTGGGSTAGKPTGNAAKPKR
jgi:hypothetical protein